MVAEYKSSLLVLSGHLYVTVSLYKKSTLQNNCSSRTLSQEDNCRKSCPGIYCSLLTGAEELGMHNLVKRKLGVLEYFNFKIFTFTRIKFGKIPSFVALTTNCNIFTENSI